MEQKKIYLVNVVNPSMPQSQPVMFATFDRIAILDYIDAHEDHIVTIKVTEFVAPVSDGNS